MFKCPNCGFEFGVSLIGVCPECGYVDHAPLNWMKPEKDSLEAIIWGGLMESRFKRYRPMLEILNEVRDSIDTLILEGIKKLNGENK